MILQALVQEYEQLVRQGKLDRPGWSPVKVSFALDIDAEGHLLDVMPMKQTVTRQEKNGKVKETQVPRIMKLPTPEKRASGIAANFLYDNSSYFLGIDNKGKPQRTLDCFAAARKRHHDLLDAVETETAQAILRFFDTWEPEKASEHPAIQPYLEELYKGGNLIFSVEDLFAQEEEEIRAAWQADYDDDSDATIMQCLVTGQRAPIAILHPNLKGIPNAQPTGAALVSFNAQAYESYGRSGAQGLNAPVSRYAAFAYSAALNYLLADRERVQRIGDTMIVCWAQSGETAYQDNMQKALNDQDLQGIMKKIADGKPVQLDHVTLDPQEPFYILGLAPNVARASVRFFLQSSFGDFMTNLKKHFDRLEIQCPDSARGKRSVWGLLQETVNQKSSNKEPSARLAGDLLRAILSGGKYPQTLLQSVEIRIRAEQSINWRRAAILKAFLMRNYDTNSKIQEVTTVRLNEDSNYTPYVLGRLFSQYERIQQWANPSITTTIRDRYFNAAASTPATIFGLLGKLSQSHLRKLEPGARISCQKSVGELLSKLDEPIPARLSLAEQMTFQLGYYHETQKRYQKKEEDN